MSSIEQNHSDNTANWQQVRIGADAKVNEAGTDSAKGVSIGKRRDGPGSPLRQSVESCRNQSLTASQETTPASAPMQHRIGVIKKREGAAERSGVLGNNVLGSRLGFIKVLKNELNTSLNDGVERLATLAHSNIETAYEVLDSLDSASMDKVVKQLYAKDPQVAFALTKFSITKEVGASDHEGALLRGTSLASKMMSATLKFCGKESMQGAFGDGAYAGSSPLVIDTTPRGVAIKTIEVKVDEMTDAVNKVLSKAISAVQERPSATMKEMFSHLHGEIAKKFPQEADKHVAATFILRYLNPLLISPEGYLDNVKLTPEKRENAIQITKILQNLANDVEYGTKEKHLMVMNDYLRTMSPVREGIIELLKGRPDRSADRSAGG